MPNDAMCRPADDLLATERARWPRWRNSSVKPTPTWFHGQELDIIDADDRALLFRSVRSGQPSVPWGQILLQGCFWSLWLRGMRSDQTRWLWMIVAVAWICLLIGSVLIRRRDIVIAARRTLRERADWPQTLNDRMVE